MEDLGEILLPYEQLRHDNWVDTGPVVLNNWNKDQMVV
jgi:hypothetical protein